MDLVTPQGSLPIDLSVSQPNTEGPSGMFGMVTALVVQEQAWALGRLASTVLPGVTAAAGGGAVRTAAREGGSSAFTCRVPVAG